MKNGGAEQRTTGEERQVCMGAWILPLTAVSTAGPWLLIRRMGV